MLGSRRTDFHPRRGRHGHRSAVVPDRLPDDNGRKEPRRHELLYRNWAIPIGWCAKTSIENLLRYLVRDRDRGRRPTAYGSTDLLEANDFAGLETLFHAFFASIPYEWYVNNDIARYEGYYASVFYSYFAALGLDIAVEDSSSHGRLDMAVLFNNNVYLFEFKVVELSSAGAATGAVEGTALCGQISRLGAADLPDWRGV